MEIIDMHCDTLSRLYRERKSGKPISLRSGPFQVDLEKMRRAGYLLQNFAVFLDLGETRDPYGDAKGIIALFREEMQKNRDIAAPATSYRDILKNKRQGKMSAILTLEEGEACGGSLEKLREFYQLGVRMMTFTWNYPNSLGFPAEPAGSPRPACGNGSSEIKASCPNCWKGASEIETSRLPACGNKTSTIEAASGSLTETGIEFLREMERIGMIPDVSHLSDAGILDVARLSRRPFCASHSNARSLCRRGRNLPDGLIRAIADCGGVIGVNFYGPFLTERPSPPPAGAPSHEIPVFYSRVADVAAHIRHIANVGGISCIGLGSDFDGIDDNLELTDCSRMELLARELKKTGFHEDEIDRIFFRNVLSFYKEWL